jgi:N-acetylmuramoyl-L-alanine amidase
MTDTESRWAMRLRHLLSRWEPLLGNPQWYLTVVPELDTFRAAIQREGNDVQQECKRGIYEFFEAHLVQGDIALGTNRKNADAERKPIDTVVIHHTSNLPGLRPDRLSAIELLRLYAPYYFHPTQQEEQHLRGEAISSGHIRNGKQVFWPYHWIVRGDGTAERLLYDSEIGWHAGDWDVNCRSVAIALDNDYEHSSPSVTELRSVAAIIGHYPGVPSAQIIGHREVNRKTACPSELFLNAPGQKGWKSQLLRLIYEQSRRAA